jgi:ribose transport system substrate-binding protein
MKRVALFLLAAALLSPVALFGGGNTEKGPITIGVSFVDLNYPYWIPMKTAAEKTAANLGVKLVFVDAQNSSMKQASDMGTFVAQKVNGILVSPVTTDLLVAAIQKAVLAGVPVATVNRKANTDKVLVYVGADFMEGGRTAAGYVIEKLGNKGTVIELEGTPGASPAIDLKKGFDEVIGKSNVKILVSQEAGYNRVMAESVMKKLMKLYPKFDAVFAANDDMVIGAIQAMSAAGIDPSKKVTVGFDASAVGLEYIKQRKLGATIDSFQAQQASQALTILVDYIRSKKKPEKSVIYISPKAVTSAQ